MPKLETQINQIFVSPQESKKLSLILFEEVLDPNLHLFLLAELRGIQKKTELNDLSKISEIIIETFRVNRKLPADAMFETTLAAINNKLADFAHKGRKSWLGKFSALIGVKTDKDFYLANTGHTCAWLKRKNDLNEVLNSDKTETHPLKTFTNFSSGRMLDGDSLILATSSIFNYVSLELFSKTLNSYSLDECCTKISSILKSSAKSEEGFAVFMLSLSKKAATAKADKAEQKTEQKEKLPVAGIYAPMPEDLKQVDPEKPSKLLPSLALPSLHLPKFSSFKFGLPKLKLNFSFLKLNFLPNVSGPAKFFFGSFILFAVLFAMNIAAYGVRKSQAHDRERFNSTAESLVNLLAEAETSLLYKNQSQAMKLMSSAETELHKLMQLDGKKSVPFENKFDEMNNKINRVTVLKNLSAVYEVPYTVNLLARAGSGYFIANENPNSLGIFTDNKLKNLFMLNKVDGEIKGIAHVSGFGNFISVKDKLYRANESSQEFEQLSYVSQADLSALKFIDPKRLYAINKTNNQVIRWTVNSASNVSAPQNILKSNVNLQEAQDLAIDADLYVLFPDHVERFINGQQVDFPLSPISEPAKFMTKIRLGAQIYILEPVAKRVLIYSKKGELLNQVQFPELTDLRDLYIDEGTRELLLVNGNKIYKITF
jgi:hypothetical protein